MNRSLIIRLGICLFIFGLCIYSYIDKQNELTSLKIKLPKIAKEIKETQEEIRKLKYEIDQFENPNHLMELARNPEYSHLKHPLLKDVLTLPEGLVLQEKNNLSLSVSSGAR